MFPAKTRAAIVTLSHTTMTIETATAQTALTRDILYLEGHQVIRIERTVKELARSRTHLPVAKKTGVPPLLTPTFRQESKEDFPSQAVHMQSVENAAFAAVLFLRATRSFQLVAEHLSARSTFATVEIGIIRAHCQRPAPHTREAIFGRDGEDPVPGKSRQSSCISSAHVQT
jgi:hypothetical protein